MTSIIRSGYRKRMVQSKHWSLNVQILLKRTVHSNFQLSLKEIFSFFVCTKKETKKNANTLRSYSARSRSYDEELGLVVTRASNRLRHLTLLSVAALNASSAIVCSCASLSLRLIWKYILKRKYPLGNTSVIGYIYQEYTN